MDIISDNNYKLKQNDLPKILKIFSSDDILILNIDMSKETISSISYVAVNLDWSKI